MELPLVYTTVINNRINYIFTQLIFRLLKIEFGITTNLNEFDTFKGPKICYTESRIGDSLWIKPSGLLHEQGINEQCIQVSDYEGLKIFFRTDDRCDLPFDIFSASFLLLSRYEEYLSNRADKHLRFEAIQSLAYLHGFLHEPLVDKWVLLLKKKLKERFPELVMPDQIYTFQPSIDIDNPFAFKHKGIFRTIGALLRALFRLDFNTLFGRLTALGGVTKDPYDTYDYIGEIEQKHNTRSLYFFLVGDYGRHDTNVPIRKIAYQNLIRGINATHNTGIHPSYSSNKSVEILGKELKRFSRVTGERIVRSRQHYLQIRMPDTYRNLIQLGIREEYSMGYASAIGFRASTSFPFKFYDLPEEKETNLLVIPFQIMDVTLHNYLRLRSTEAMTHISKIIDEVKAVNGYFIPIWHNESLSEYGMWTGWRKVFEDMFEYASENKPEEDRLKEEEPQESL
ncbi:MAG: polysaccharide deacetylase family protein [Bacteroidales bacterium]|nr:polysaccharide deacetylase family protein [Bacteroidales bacterium]